MPFKTRSRDRILSWRCCEDRWIGLTRPGMYLSLSSSGPVKWNHNQESSLFQDVSPFSPEYNGRSTTTLSERIRELYLQFLWLPEVRMIRHPAFFFFFLVPNISFP